MIECNGIVKRYPNVAALDGITFKLDPNKITGVLGENGAGKSTLMNVIFGLVQPDAGSMILSGKKYKPGNPADAVRNRVGMVHQNQMLIDGFSVIENVVIGNEPHNSAGLIDFKNIERRLEEIFDSLGSEIDPRSLVDELDPFDRQTVELAKVLYRDAELIILDEPTTLLAPIQIEMFFKTLEKLKKNGKTIILVTHRIAEVEAVVEDVMILSRGKLVEHCPLKDIKKEALVSLIMTGSEKGSGGRILEKKSAKKDKPNTAWKKHGRAGLPAVIEMMDICTSAREGGRNLEELNLQVGRGEILGITGIPGNGQTHLIELLSGLRGHISGKMIFEGEEAAPSKMNEIRKKHIGCIFPQRDEQGLILSMSVEENMLLNAARLDGFSMMGWLKRRDIRKFCKEASARFDVKNAGCDSLISSLSGGNRQKIVLAREIVADVSLIVAGEPSRGLDIKTTAELKNILADMRDSGAGILIVSGDLDFLFSVSDRIGVLYKGSISCIKDRASADAKSVSSAMLGY